jgi:hypothetical protein
MKENACEMEEKRGSMIESGGKERSGGRRGRNEHVRSGSGGSGDQKSSRVSRATAKTGCVENICSNFFVQKTRLGFNPAISSVVIHGA